MFTIHRSSRLNIIVGALALGLAGCRTPQPPDLTHYALENPVRTSEVIQIGDVLDITIRDVPGHVPILTVRVGLEGSTTLPFHVTLTAAGKTTSALAQDIRTAYVPSHFVNMEVQITIKTGPVCLVVGEVKGYGRLVTSSDLTVLRAIEVAGGPTQWADLKHIQLRCANGEIVKVDWNKARRNPKHEPPASLTAGGVIIIPRLKNGASAR